MSNRLQSGAFAELLGTAFLLAAVVGPGITGDRLYGGNVATALPAHAVALPGANSDSELLPRAMPTRNSLLPQPLHSI